MSLGRRIAAEFVRHRFPAGGHRRVRDHGRDPHDRPGLQLLQNALATAGALAAVILALGSVSGVHLNPAVTLADRAFGGLTTRETIGYIGALIAGGASGVIAAP
jgi:glycerol uptake facilitator-like aquaporin